MVKVFSSPLSPNILSWYIVIQSTEDFCLISFSVDNSPPPPIFFSCCTLLTTFVYTLTWTPTVWNLDVFLFIFTPAMHSVIYTCCVHLCSYWSVWLLIWLLSSTGEASSSKCGQTPVPWDFSLFPVHRAAGVGKIQPRCGHSPHPFQIFHRLHLQMLQLSTNVCVLFSSMCCWLRQCECLHCTVSSYGTISKSCVG